MEEDGGGAAGENGRAVEGLGDRRDAEGLEIFAHGEGLRDKDVLVGQAAKLVGFEGLDAIEVHAVRGAGAADDDEAGDVVRCADPGAVRGDKVVDFV